MANASYSPYTTFAKQFVESGYRSPDRPLKLREQYVINIYHILKDGEWRTAQEIGDKLGIGKRTVQYIMQAIADPFEIASGQQGYCIPQKHTILIA